MCGSRQRDGLQVGPCQQGTNQEINVLINTESTCCLFPGLQHTTATRGHPKASNVNANLSSECTLGRRPPAPLLLLALGRSVSAVLCGNSHDVSIRGSIIDRTCCTHSRACFASCHVAGPFWLLSHPALTTSLSCSRSRLWAVAIPFGPWCLPIGMPCRFWVRKATAGGCRGSLTN